VSSGSLLLFVEPLSGHIRGIDDTYARTNGLLSVRNVSPQAGWRIHIHLFIYSSIDLIKGDLKFLLSMEVLVFYTEDASLQNSKR
jgi:hypothetical protein